MRYKRGKNGKKKVVNKVYLFIFIFNKEVPRRRRFSFILLSPNTPVTLCSFFTLSCKSESRGNNY